MLVLCALFWSFSFPGMKALLLIQQQILPDAGSWFISSLSVVSRFLIAGTLMFCLSWTAVRTVNRLEVEQGLWLGLFTAGGILLQMDGLAYTSASTSAFLTQLYCVLIPVWLALRRKHFPSQKIFICGALVLIGMAVLVRLDFRDLKLGRGELETVAASVVFVAQILCLEHPRFRGNRPQCLTTIMLFASGLFTLPVLALTAPSVSACFRLYTSLPACGLLAMIVLFCTLGAFILMNRWQHHISATEAGLVYTAEPVFASVLALFLPGIISAWAGINYPNETLSVPLLVGGGLITVANVLLQSHWLEKK